MSITAGPNRIGFLDKSHQASFDNLDSTLSDIMSGMGHLADDKARIDLGQMWLAQSGFPSKTWSSHQLSFIPTLPLEFWKQVSHNSW